MTDKQHAALDRIFRRYGSPSPECNERLYIYHTRSDHLHTCEDVSREDKRTADRIRELELLLESLNAHRAALSERYAELATAPTVPVVKLSRVRANCYSRDKGKVFYYLETFDRNLNDGHEVRTSSAEYPGTERRKAIADYHEYVKKHPSILHEMDIEKPKWER